MARDIRRYKRRALFAQAVSVGLTWVDPGFKGRSVVGSEIPAQVFVDPKFNTPAAIKIEQGILWANPFSRDSLQ